MIAIFNKTLSDIGFNKMIALRVDVVTSTTEIGQ